MGTCASRRRRSSASSWRAGGSRSRNAEYCMAVPANRLGSAVYTTVQLKTVQEIVTLLVFAGFSILYLKEPITWNHAVGFALVATGAFSVFRGSAVTWHMDLAHG